ncbi:uncharacterized protein LOC125817109 [Solanum verrucosum]|uniref:uncharacterized protein LOC125817109 n=1 Tax=Solanum verrucosum TaxID=315347 RepID=UPI0020D04191|nr:uncharacterized protein LOC125817109 [Solanum verrucosum]
MTEEKEVKVQINEFHKLVEDLKSEKIILPEQFVAYILIEKLLESWNDYKQNLKHKQKLLSLEDLVKHIIIEDTNRKQSYFAKAKEIATKANFVKTLSDHAVQCRNRAGKNDNPGKPRVNLAEADDIIVAVISQANLVANVSDWVIDSVNEGEEVVYLGDSSTTQVLGKGKVLLKLTSEKTLALTEVLHVPSIRTNLVFVGLLGKVGVKVAFKSGKVVITKNNVFVGKRYCNHGLFVLNVSQVMSEDAST